MYCFLLVLLFLALFCAVFFHCRRKKIIRKIQDMDEDRKCFVLEELVRPFGYCYYSNTAPCGGCPAAGRVPGAFHDKCGFFSTTLDAWQREAGYTWLYDDVAPRLDMVFDSLPVYFNYDGRTWMIEFWKGQYGINTGAEIGIYHADKIISKKDYRTTWFACASDGELLDCSFVLCDKDGDCIRITRRHWWLTAFLPGCFAQPYDLYMRPTLNFPNRRMQSAFIKGLCHAGYTEQDLKICGLSLTFTFFRARDTRYSLRTRFWRRFSQWKNRIFCGLYLRMTKPFQCTQDRVLCLYYHLPAAFRRLLRLRRFHKRCHRKRRCCRKNRCGRNQCRKKGKCQKGSRS